MLRNLKVNAAMIWCSRIGDQACLPASVGDKNADIFFDLA